VVADPAVLETLRISDETFEELTERERRELRRRVACYRGARPLPDVAGRSIVLVDDGLATGVTAEAALQALRQRRPASLVLAAPTCAAEAAVRLGAIADDVVCLLRATTSTPSGSGTRTSIRRPTRKSSSCSHALATTRRHIPGRRDLGNGCAR
jgi:predicted phosphoribosyltransferase